MKKILIIMLGALIIPLSVWSMGWFRSVKTDDTGTGLIYSLTGSRMQEILKNPVVDGIAYRTAWNVLEPQEGQYDWRGIDSIINKCESYHKKISIAIHPGTSTPDWVYQKGARKMFFIDDNPYHSTYGQTFYYPMPWDEVFLQEWGKFINAFADRYRDDLTVSHVRISGGMNTMSIEWHPPTAADWEKYAGTQDEWSMERFINAMKQTVDIFATALPNKFLLMAIAPTKVSDSVPPYHMEAATEVVDYGYAAYPGQFMFQTNGWRNYDEGMQHPIFDLYKKYAPNTGAQMVWSATNDPDCRMNSKHKPCNPVDSMTGAIECAKEYEIHYLEIYAVDATNPALQSILEKF